VANQSLNYHINNLFPDISHKLPLLARDAYNSIKGVTSDDPISTQVTKIGQQIIVIRLVRVQDSVIFDYEIGGIEYNYMELGDALTKNFKIAKNKFAEIKAIFETIINELAIPASGIGSIVNTENTVKSPTLEKYIAYLEKETYRGVWSDIINYPLDNVQRGLKKHLMIGFSSNTGKSIIINALYQVYKQVAIMKGNRPEFEFSAGQWNAQVIKSFLILIDDDDENNHISQDFIKNFLNDRMPLQLASQSQRWSDFFHGSTVIATNTEEAFFKKTQNDKRIALLRLDNPMSGFTDEEQEELHNLTAKEVLHYVESSNKNQLLDIKNRWTNEEDDLDNQIKTYLRLSIVASLSELKRNFDKKDIKRALGPAKTFTFQRKHIYGYKSSDIVVGKQEDDDKPIKVSTYLELTTKKPTVQEMTLEDLKQCIEKAIQLPKEEQPLINLTMSKNSREESFEYSDGLILDIDHSNFDSLDEIKLDKTFLAYETPSSRKNGNGLRYRILIPYMHIDSVESWKEQCLAVAEEIGEVIDRASVNPVHRFFIGGSNVIIHRNNTNKLYGAAQPAYAEEQRQELGKNGIINRVKNAVDGERNNITFWALERALEDNDQELMEEILEVSPCPENEIESFRKRYIGG